jgi:hypothetical protein
MITSRAATPRRARRQPFVALVAQQLPHAGAVQRRAGVGQHLGDLHDRQSLRAQPQHLCAGRLLGRCHARARAARDEEVAVAGSEVAHHRLHRGGRVPEPVGDLRRGRAVAEVRAQRLVAAVRNPVGVGEELRPRPRPTMRLIR